MNTTDYTTAEQAVEHLANAGYYAEGLKYAMHGLIALGPDALEAAAADPELGRSVRAMLATLAQFAREETGDESALAVLAALADGGE